jgi:succinate--hydroxymethylglutarate CoA-transferase
MDLCTGLYLHGAISAALVSRQKTGRGQKLDASLFETTLALMTNVAMSWLNLGREARRWGTGHPSIVPYEVFKTRDSSLVLGAVNNRQFKVMCERLGRKELAEDERFVDNDLRVKHRVELKRILDGIFARKTTDEWLGVFEGSGMPYGPVNTLQKAFEHPQAAARHMVQTIDHEATVEGTLKVLGRRAQSFLFVNIFSFSIGSPVKFSETQPSIRSSPPALGGDTDGVLREMGWSMEKIARLRQEGVL